jgi:hypothetical protein
MVMVRRGYRSAMFPLGTARRRAGTTCTTPIRPSAHGSLVRSYSSQPTATEMNCKPICESVRPAMNGATWGARSAAKLS